MPDFDMFDSTSKAGCFMDEKQLQALANALAKISKYLKISARSIVC
ncbi:hypothetical protein LTSEINV_4332 [Salmonella enterica subsp. enterica serovar Inverness str. R8-3668]|uniref:Uncharacterized protein n=12 Tax=Salmonella enterica I TaxID=59201 RepID=A0A6C8GJE1_SALET|nr:hypothetical protein SCH_2839 [Salmonella enterica subsp. enterica serovar Choleraesuis str. SC-B67]ACN47042.1 putative transposase [Salmonella enterica subsp. enterica serovar Paratyphi C str. RKS4594]AGS30971.1 hypothetical protein SN31241_40000 [Salmonella enterica subsp. enterica serovar Newport str. USMARC-S3124.1]EFZ07464.1 hypothetical protein SCA50_3025 [Salmonella enterica subsp. enterica serovar Choleraesuis str. SCSA50]EGE30983.1 hypothetical protein SD3246_3114 [Salmonella enteri